MVKSKDFMRLESLETHVVRNLTIGFADLDCNFLAGQIKEDSLKRKLLSRARDFYSNSDVTQIMRQANATKNNGSLTGKRESFEMPLHFSCSSVGNQIISKKETYISQQPVLSLTGLNFLSKNSKGATHLPGGLIW